jgi:hypothetical protein
MTFENIDGTQTQILGKKKPVAWLLVCISYGEAKIKLLQ